MNSSGNYDPDRLGNVRRGVREAWKFYVDPARPRSKKQTASWARDGAHAFTNIAALLDLGGLLQEDHAQPHHHFGACRGAWKRHQHARARKGTGSELRGRACRRPCPSRAGPAPSGGQHTSELRPARRRRDDRGLTGVPKPPVQGWFAPYLQAWGGSGQRPGLLSSPPTPQCENTSASPPYPRRSSRARAGRNAKHRSASASRPSRRSSASSLAHSACRCRTSDAA